MKILIVRHGDPNYEIDGLTEKGEREVILLARRLSLEENLNAIYSSPLGRAIKTAEPTEKAVGMTAKILHWLKEFDYAKVKLPYEEEAHILWDNLPSFINTLENIYHPTRWLEAEHIKNSDVPKFYQEVCDELDCLLKKHGYERSGYNYKAIAPNHDTIILFCHFGVTAVLLSHLLNCSPYTVWQHMCTAPTSVTTIYTEERVKGIAQFRAASIGDVSHLYKADEPPAFAARFCECFTDGTRH